jgi:hypothetical protein
VCGATDYGFRTERGSGAFGSTEARLQLEEVLAMRQELLQSTPAADDDNEEVRQEGDGVE